MMLRGRENPIHILDKVDHLIIFVDKRNFDWKRIQYHFQNIHSNIFSESHFCPSIPISSIHQET